MTTCPAPRLIILWSAPRCRSTAFERMMTERGDFTVVHEPHSHLADFASATVDGRAVRSPAQLTSALYALARWGPVFVKDTTDFRYPDVVRDRHFLRTATHTFLIRDPAAAIMSHRRLNPKLGRDEIGFGWLHEIFVAAGDATGTVPVVIDADELVADPAGLVAGYCARVGIPYLAHALTWRAGMLPQWRRTERWHIQAGATTGFVASGPAGPDATAAVLSDPVLRGYLTYHRPYHAAMHAVRLRAGAG